MIALLLAACSVNVFDAPAYWHVADRGYNAPIYWVRVQTTQQLSSACATQKTASGACSMRRAEHCFVILGPEADWCAAGHEIVGHCMGRDHGPDPVEKQNCGDTP